MNLDSARQTFVAESNDLLQAMEDALLRLETVAADGDALNAVFRAAHTIKGSAGLFGLDDIVAFTHLTENVLDRWRAGRLAPDAGLVALMFECRDHIARLIEHGASEGTPALPELTIQGEALAARLRACLGEPAPGPAAPAAPVPVVIDGAPGDADTWHISLRFGRDVLRNGMDPLSFIRYLGTLGAITALETLDDALPAAAEMDPESCYLGYEIALKSRADQATIAAAFDFVREDCAIRILPPHSRTADFLVLLTELPEDKLRLGEILMRCGALTARELEAGLAAQAQARAVAESTAPPLGAVLVERGAVPQVLVDAAVAQQHAVKEKKAQETSLIRVQADKLDTLIGLVGELVIAGAAANLAANRAGDSALNEATATVMRLVEHIRDGALQLRMVQIGETFHRFHRVVRDVARELNKEIELTVSGAECELDKSVVERIGDPLVHLVRNAVDHGIEPAERRRALGKPERGHVRLNAFHDSGSIVIEVADDGGGLDRDRILRKARERGLVAPEADLSDEDIHRLIFAPGFSTVEQVTNLSGRGVGMDVVRRNIEAVRGTIDIDTRLGRGTTMRIRLPLTLAIIDGFLLSVAGRALVVPLDLIVECLELGAQDRRAAGVQSCINLRGEVLPFLRLRELFALTGAAGRRESVVVVQYGGRKVGLVVDALLGEFQTVIKPLGNLFQHLRGVSGTTILGSGEVALILDVPALIQLVRGREERTLAA